MSHAQLKLRLALMAGRHADALRHLADVEREERDRRGRLHAELEKTQALLQREKELRFVQKYMRDRQQRGNEARRAVDDGWEEDADRRHRAGEPWKTIALSYSYSPSRCRLLVYRWRRATRRRTP